MSKTIAKAYKEYKKAEDTIEKRVLRSNLSDEDKIEIIKKLNEKPYYYPVYVPNNPYPTYTTITCSERTEGACSGLSNVTTSRCN